MNGHEWTLIGVDLFFRRKKSNYLLKLCKKDIKITKNPKKKKQEGDEFPLSLVWVSEELSLVTAEEEEGLKRINGFSLFAPNRHIMLFASTLDEKEKVFGEIKASVTEYLKEKNIVHNDSESRAEKFTFPNIGTYDGYWLKGMMHGEGTFTSGEMSFTGHWHSLMKAGFGFMIKDSIKTENVGWEYSVPFSGVVVVSDQEDPNLKKIKTRGAIPKIDLWDFEVGSDEIVTKRDLELIFSKGGEVLKISTPTKVIVSQEINIYLFRIKSGSVTFQKKITDNEVSEEILSSPTMFGEMGIFDRPNYGDYIANADTELYSVEISDLYRTLGTNPDLSRRFNLQIAKTLASKLIQIGSETHIQEKITKNLAPLPVVDKPKRGSSPLQSPTSDDMYKNSYDPAQSGPLHLENSGGHPSMESSNSGAVLLETEPTDPNKLFSEFSVWNLDNIIALTKYFSDGVTYKDPYTLDNILGKSSFFEYRELIHKDWLNWTFEVSESQHNGNCFTTKALLVMHDNNQSNICEKATIDYTVEDNLKISRLEVSFDTSRIPNFKVINFKPNPVFIHRSSKPDPSRVSDTDLLEPATRNRNSREHKYLRNKQLSSPLIIQTGPDDVKKKSSDPKIRQSDDSVVINVKDADADSDGALNSSKSSKRNPGDKPKTKDSNNMRREDLRLNEPDNIEHVDDKIKSPTKAKLLDSPSGNNNKGTLRPANVRHATDVAVLSKPQDFPIERKQQMGRNSVKPQKRQKESSISWTEKFDLPEKDKELSIIKEVRCQVPSLALNKFGVLIISTKYLCYSSETFGISTKEVIPIKSISETKPKIAENLIKIKINRKKAISVKSKFLVTHTSLIFTFSTNTETTEVNTIIQKLTGNNRHSDDETDEIPHPESQVNSEITKTNLDTSIPNIELAYSKSSPAVRLYGPKRDEIISTPPPPGSTGTMFSGAKVYRAKFQQEMGELAGEKLTLGDEVCVISVSTYPLKTLRRPDGSIEYLNDRLGDPICDQFCLERFQNRTIFALADGCNWGPKVRATAKLAAQTFVEYCKKTIFEVETTQATMKAFLQSFGHIHNRIIEGKESTWWECATTTLLGGCLLEVNDPDHKWAFLCLSVGDCKAYHITTRSNKISVADITQGSRTGKGSLDARDCGGRLGPYKKGGHPDLRNLAAFFEYVEEDDFILLMTDGVYDNLDPQSLGIPIEETGLKTNLKGSDWSLFADVDDEQLLHDIEEYKTKYMVDTVRDLVEESLKEKGITFHELQAEQIAEKLINQALKITKNSRVYMEQHPGEPQPVDYKAFPGKVDHTTCIVMKVSSTNFRQWEVDLSDLVVRLRHPTYGITKEAEGIQKGTFQGKDLETWINQDPEYSETGEDFPQALMNFNYISTVTNQDSYIYETFNPDLLYQFKVHVPIMTNRDWKAILQGTARKSFSRGEVIISEGENQSNIYHITFGTCKVRKQITTSQPSLKPKKDWMPRRLNSGQVKTESRENSTQFKILGTIGAPQTLGEISLLLNTKATASVIADSDQVEVLVLEKNFMNIMFVRYPDMAGRFYHYLASILARRLGFHESD